jgi:hypothetical protein
VLDQCVGLPDEISRFITHHLQQLCAENGCHTLNQLQYLLRVSGAVDSVFELLLLRLDEQGLVISSPWPLRGGTLILETIWPNIWAAWKTKEQWTAYSNHTSTTRLPRANFAKA